MAAAQAMLERSSETESAPAPAPSTRPSQSQWLIGRPSEVPEAEEEEEEGEDEFEDRWTGAKPPIRQSRFTIGNTRRQTIVEALADLEAGALGGQALNDLAVTRVQSVVAATERVWSRWNARAARAASPSAASIVCADGGARRDSRARAADGRTQQDGGNTPAHASASAASPAPPAGTGWSPRRPILAVARRSEVEGRSLRRWAVRVATEEEQEAARRIQRKFHFAKGR